MVVRSYYKHSGLILWKIPRFVFVAVVNSASVVKTSRPGQRGAAVLLGFLFGSSLVVCSAALRGAHRFDSGLVRDLRVSVALGGSELAFAIVAWSRSLQFMTLHSGFAFALVVAFLVTSVALKIGLVGRPFVRLSFVLSLPGILVGTWLA